MSLNICVKALPTKRSVVKVSLLIHLQLSIDIWSPAQSADHLAEGVVSWEACLTEVPVPATISGQGPVTDFTTGVRIVSCAISY